MGCCIWNICRVKEVCSVLWNIKISHYLKEKHKNEFLGCVWALCFVAVVAATVGQTVSKLILNPIMKG